MAEQETVVITGSSGLVGSALRRRVGDQYDLIGMDRPPKDYHDPDVRFVGIDLSEDESVRTAMEHLSGLGVHHIAAVVHLAAFYDFSGAENALYDAVTVQGTRRLLEGLRASFEVESFIFSSTMLVHKPSQPRELITEDWPLEPTWPYPKSKAETERVISQHRNGIPAVILRMSGVYDDYCNSIPIAQQINRIYDKKLTSHLWPGDKQSAQSFVHLDDLVEAIERVIVRRKELGDECVLLIGEEDAVPYSELQDELGRLLHGNDWLTVEIPKALAKAGAWVRDVVPGPEPFIQPWMVDIADARYELDISKARRLLDWAPRRSLREALPLMVGALKRNPGAWYEHHGLGNPPEQDQ